MWCELVWWVLYYQHFAEAARGQCQNVGQRKPNSSEHRTERRPIKITAVLVVQTKQQSLRRTMRLAGAHASLASSARTAKYSTLRQFTHRLVSGVNKLEANLPVITGRGHVRRCYSSFALLSRPQHWAPAEVVLCRQLFSQTAVPATSHHRFYSSKVWTTLFPPFCSKSWLGTN